MKIVEYFSAAKCSSKPCEDRLVVTEDFVAVIDGSTSKGSYSCGEHTTGWMAAELVAECIRNMSRRCTVKQAVRMMTAYIARYCKKEEVEEMMLTHPENRLTCSVVVYSDYRKELWMIGDCFAKVGDILYQNPKPMEALLANMRSAKIRMELLKGMTEEQLRNDDLGRKSILPFLKEQCIFQNNPLAGEYGYGVIDGFEVAIDNIKVYTLPNIPDAEVILASDGYPVIGATLEESEIELQKLLAEDPLCYKKNKATKGLSSGFDSFDDRTYVRFSI